MFLFKKKYHDTFCCRLGIKKQETAQSDFWVHAVSLGEVKLALRFIESFKKIDPQLRIALSCSTEAGMSEAKKELSRLNCLFYLPFDYPFILEPLVKKINPKGAIFVEGDLWPNLLNCLNKANISVGVINAKLSTKSFERYSRCKFFSKLIFSKLDLVCSQSEEYAKKFQRLGCVSVKMTGNMKFDLEKKKEELELLDIKNIFFPHHKDKWILVIGSTHRKEEALLIDVLQPLVLKYPEFLVCLAPRHDYRFEEVKNLFILKKIKYDCFSSKKEVLHQWFLIDAMGVLNSFYQAADGAVVGGSFVKVGGHNILEPLLFGKMTLFGPYMFSQKEITKQALDSGLATQLTLGDLPHFLERTLHNKKKLSNKKKEIEAFFTQNRGATERNVQEMKKLFQF